MATIAAGLPGARSIRLRPGLVVALLGAAAAAAYLWMRVPTALAMHRGLAGICARLEMRPGDWPCEVTSSATSIAYLPSALLIALGIVVPCLVLVASGRRIAALVPLLVPIVSIAGIAVLNVVLSQSTSPRDPLLGIWDSVMSFGDVSETVWTTRPWLTASIDAMLIGVPVIAAALLAWRRDRSAGTRRGKPPVGAVAAWLSLGAVAAAITTSQILWTRIGSWTNTATMFAAEDSWVPVLVMAGFGIFLGTDRRWWPWIFLPVAVLLSAAFPYALTGSIVHLPAFFGFGAVAPLASVGVLASSWRPLAEAFGRLRARHRGVELATSPHATPPSRTVRPSVRGIVVANAAAAGVLVVSLIAAKLDPLPIDIATTLPTYLGARTQIDDLRARFLLRDGLAALERFHEEHGTFEGFDPSVAGGLRWAPRPLAGRPDGLASPFMTLDLVRADASSAQLLVASRSRDVVCARTEATAHGALRTWGRSGSRGPLDARVAIALAACDDLALGASAFRPLPIDELCDGEGDTTIMICRAVQRLLREELSKIPAPAGG